MNIWTDQIIQFVEDSVNDFDEKMSLLIFQGRTHQEGEDLVKERSRTELSCFFSESLKCRLSHSEEFRS